MTPMNLTEGHLEAFEEPVVLAARLKHLTGLHLLARSREKVAREFVAEPDHNDLRVSKIRVQSQRECPNWSISLMIGSVLKDMPPSFLKTVGDLFKLRPDLRVGEHLLDCVHIPVTLMLSHTHLRIRHRSCFP